jgi:hypothetical protein
MSKTTKGRYKENPRAKVANILQKGTETEFEMGLENEQ